MNSDFNFPYKSNIYGCPCCNIIKSTKSKLIHCKKCHNKCIVWHSQWEQFSCSNCGNIINNKFYIPEYGPKNIDKDKYFVRPRNNIQYISIPPEQSVIYSID